MQKGCIGIILISRIYKRNCLLTPKEKNKQITINKHTANRFVTVITSPIIWYEVFGKHGAFCSVITPVVHLATSETSYCL